MVEEQAPLHAEGEVVYVQHGGGSLTQPVAAVIKPGYKPPNLSDTQIRKTDMAIQRTFSIIKPDATRRNLTGKIIAKFEEAGLRVVASKRIHMTKAQAEGFYAVHKERPFFNDLVSFMISGPVVVQVLEGEDAIAKNREVMGATNPANAAPGTIRKEFAESIEANSVHGSDAPETAAEEIKYFFTDAEIVG
jgi:nucleoside-diphosphate kinase